MDSTVNDLEVNQQSKGLEEDENLPLSRRRQPRSNVWGFFYRVPGLSVANGKSVCLACHMEFSCTAGSTTSIRMHLKLKHKDLFKKMTEMDKKKKKGDIRDSKTHHSGFQKVVRSSSDEIDGLRQAICDAWQTKLYSDMVVFCGMDGGQVRSHKLFLAALSPYLSQVLAAQDMHQDDLALVLPDVSSEILSEFLSNVCSGNHEAAELHTSLEYLEFGQPNPESIQNDTSFSVKSEPEIEIPNDPTDEFELDNDNDFYFQADDLDEDVDYTPNENKRVTRRLLSKRKKRSLTWRYFDLIDGSLANCKTCQTMVKTEKGNTSGMAGHLRSVHPDLYRALKSSRDANESFEADGDVLAIADIDIKTSVTVPILTEEANIEQDEATRPKRKKRSLVWNYFEQLDKNNAICTTCSVKVKTDTGNTTGMANHLKGFHHELYQELQESRGGKQQQKQLLEEQHLEAVQDDDSEPESSSPVKNELPEVTVNSSPVWQFFEPDSAENHVKCVECDQVLRKKSGDTSLLIRHLMKDHEELYTSCIKDKFEKPDLPDPGDTAHPVWQFFENIALDTAASNEDNVGSARCKDCLGLFSFPETDVEPLEEHLRSDHRPNLDSYEALCIEWRQQRLEEAQRMNDSDTLYGSRRKTGPRTTRSAVWNYFKKTDEKIKNICVTCGKMLVCNQQNTTNMIRHLECNHHDLFVQFLKDSGSPDENVKGASEDKIRKRRGPKRGRCVPISRNGQQKRQRTNHQKRKSSTSMRRRRLEDEEERDEKEDEWRDVDRDVESRLEQLLQEEQQQQSDDAEAVDSWQDQESRSLSSSRPNGRKADAIRDIIDALQQIDQQQESMD